MQKTQRIKIVIFIIFVSYMIAEMLIKIPVIINNFIYGTMAIFAIYFIITNRKEIGIDKIFKKEIEEENEEK